MSNPIRGKTIILGVTGSIACYKAADLASKLTQAGAKVEVILTESAEKFVSPITFQSVTGRRAYGEADLWGYEAHVLHVGLGHSTNLMVIAPATANTIAKLAHGQADNLLTVTALAARCPLMIAPAMDAGMYDHPATQANVEILQQRGAIILGPNEGRMASGLSGVGRMVEPPEILGEVRRVLSKDGTLKGRKIVVTAGGTEEPIDPVRVITNHSSGKQGFHLAQAALDLGAEVTLVAAPVNLPTPSGAKRINVQTAEQMLNVVLREVECADALIMAAAPADFRPVNPAAQKLKKSGGVPQIELELAPDILAHVARLKEDKGYPRLTIGFAAESENLFENAAAKLRAKKLNLMVGNDVSAPDAGFAVDTNRVILIEPEGTIERLPLLTKSEVSEIVMTRVCDMLGLYSLER
jgi:phosphopantothenoylcysteine decarboxylase / phosphopantothenate---cysteine ligase